MLGQLLVSALAFQALASASPLTVNARDSSVKITSLTKNETSTSGSANAAASGNLAPFGEIGTGCGINWQDGSSFGGGLQAGSSSYGLGSGFTATPENITIGAGIGLNAANASANIQFTGSKNGTFELVFESSGLMSCVPGMKNGKSVITCTSM